MACMCGTGERNPQMEMKKKRLFWDFCSVRASSHCQVWLQGSLFLPGCLSVVALILPGMKISGEAATGKEE